MRTLIQTLVSYLHLPMLATAAYLLAVGGSTLVGALLTPSPEPVVNMTAELLRQATTPGPRDFALSSRRNIFVSLREHEARTNVDASGQGSRAEADRGMAATALPLVLIATSVYEQADASLATLQHTTTQTSDIYSVQACRGRGSSSAGARLIDLEPAQPCRNVLGAARIVAIERTRVILFNTASQRTEYLELGAAPTRVARRAAPRPAGSPLLKGIEQTGPGAFRLRRETVDSALQDLSALEPARVVPSFVDGAMQGFKLFSVRPGGLYSSLGIQNGDVIKRINGYSLDRPEALLEMYSKLKSTTQVTLDLSRRGAPVTLEYAIGQ